MGALARVKVHYCSLPQLIESLTDIPVYGTFLNGNIIYAESLSAHGLIVMGNEGKGVSPEVERLINKKLYNSQLSSRTGNLRIVECGNCHSSGLLGVQKTFIALKFIFPSVYVTISEWEIL